MSEIQWKPFNQKHKDYIKASIKNHIEMQVAEGAVGCGKTIDNCIVASMFLETCRQKIHLASGSTLANAKLNIGECNGFGLEHLFKGRCRWGKFKENDALFIQTKTGEKVVVFAGGGKADSYKRILGNRYGLWVATEINEHYDSKESRTSFIKVAFGRQIGTKDHMTLWDLNPCNPKHPIYTSYVDKFLEGYQGGYYYAHFVLDDNMAIPEEEKQAIKSRYDPNTVWYKRDILGMRVTADGLVYPRFANNQEQYLIDKRDLPTDFDWINIGTDFGGNKSAHAITATACRYDTLYVLKSTKIEAHGTDNDDVEEFITDFADSIIREYGYINNLYCDHLNTFVNTLQNKGYPATYAYKNEIVERVKFENKLFKKGRIWFVRDQCKDLTDGLASSIFDVKASEKGLDVRADTDKTDNDNVDSFEYTITNEMNMLNDLIY